MKRFCNNSRRGRSPCAATLASFFCLATLLPDSILRAEEAQQPHEHAHEHRHGDEHPAVETIIVTASPLEHSQDELATPVDQLDRGEIVESLGATLGETLAHRPGISTTGFSGGASRPVIRGQDAFRTEVLEGGLSTGDISRLSPDHAVPINPLAVQSLEIVRGPAVLRYGGGASAGVINAITKRVPQQLEDDPIRAEAIGAYGSNKDQADAAGVLDGGVGSFGWHLDGLYRKSDDYDNGAGRRQRGTDTEAWSLAAGGAYFFEQGRLGIGYAHNENEYGIPEDTPVQIEMRTNSYRFEGDLDEPLDGLRKVTVRGVYSDYKHDEIAGGMVGQTFNNKEFDGRLELLHEPLLGFQGAAGFHGRYQDLKASGEAAEFLAPSETRSFAFYLFEERRLGDAFDLTFGLRTEGTWVEGTPIAGRKRDRGFAPLSGSVALLAHVSEDWTIGGTASASQRAPSQVELFARGPHEATGTFEVGNPGFDEETSYTGELRVQGKLARTRLEVATFATFYEDLIFGQLTGVRVDEDGTPDPMGELKQLFFQNRDAAFYGGEARIGIELLELFGGVLGSDWQIDYVRARFTDGDGNRNVPRIPPLRWGGSLVYEHDRTSGRFGFLRHEAQWDSATNEFATGSFTILDLSARYRLPWSEDAMPLEIRFAARNLLDERARNAVSFNKDQVLLPGRNFRVGLHGRF